MSDGYRLVRRNSVWYYRRRVPEALRNRLGKLFVQHSLGTKDKAVAKKHRAIEDIKWDAQFAALEQNDSALLPKASQASVCLEDLVRDYVRKMDKMAEDRFHQHPPHDQEEQANAFESLGYELGVLRTPGHPQQDEWVSRTWDMILDGTHAAVGLTGLSREHFASLIRRALIELSRRRLARFEHQFDETHFDELFNPSHQRQVTFGQLAEDYLAARKDAAKLNNRTEKTVDKIVTNVALVCEIVGDKTLVKDIDHDACEKFLKLLASTPTNRTKLYPGMELQKVIEQACKDKKPTLSPTTQSQYLTAFRDIMERATSKRLVNHNPVAKLKPLVKSKLAAHEKRKPFTAQQLAHFFKSDFFRKCGEDSGFIYSSPNTIAHFWMPLICIFTGMRPREIAQIELSDIKGTQLGTRYIDVVSIDDEEEASNHDGQKKIKKTIKTAASRRQIPIHSQLSALGFWKLVERHKNSANNDRYLLPGLQPDKYGDRAALILKRFNRTYIRKAIDLKDRQSFYSFRHSFRDALRRCNAPADTLQAIGGWTQSVDGKDGKVVSDDYGDKTNADLQKDWVEKVTYPGLDLTHLF